MSNNNEDHPGEAHITNDSAPEKVGTTRKHEDDSSEDVPRKIQKLEDDNLLEEEDPEVEEEEEESYNNVDEPGEGQGAGDYEVISDSDGSENFDLEDIQEEVYDSDENSDDIKAIKDCQVEIEEMNQNANMEILHVEQKYNKLKKPIFQKRNRFISRVPNFWSRAIINHPQLQSVMTGEDVNCLKYLNELVVQDFKNDRSTGYKIKFVFDENPWFEESVIIKEYHLPWHGVSSCTCSEINWKNEMDLTTRKSSFFCWFTSQSDTSADDIAEIIKEDLWTDPLRFFEGKSAPISQDESMVLLDTTQDDYEQDDSSVEYISSDGEEFQEDDTEQLDITGEHQVNKDDFEDSNDIDSPEYIDESGENIGESAENFDDATGNSDLVQNADDTGDINDDSAEYADQTINLEHESDESEGHNGTQELNCELLNEESSHDSTQDLPLSLKSNDDDDSIVTKKIVTGAIEQNSNHSNSNGSV